MMLAIVFAMVAFVMLGLGAVVEMSRWGEGRS
jgi:hypothetical protein